MMLYCRENIHHRYALVKEEMGKMRYVCSRCQKSHVIDARDNDELGKTQLRELLQPYQPMFWFEFGKVERLHTDHLLKALPYSGWIMPEMDLKDLNHYEHFKR